MQIRYCHKTLLLVTFIVPIFSTISCKKFVQVNPPDTELVTTDVFNNMSTATSAVTAIYALMFNNAESWNTAQCQGLLADELTNYSTILGQRQLYINALEAVTSPSDWANMYNYIYDANAVIEGLQNNGNIPQAVAQQLTGEAKFIRAFWHFYLTNEYGDVPLVTTTSYTVNISAKRTPQADVYAQIVQDLKDAEAELNTNYVDVTDTTFTTERTRPTKAAAEGLLARVYLYTKKYDSAKQQANMVIANPLYSLCPITVDSPNSPFLANSTEAIWQLATTLPTNIDTYDNQDFILLGAPGTQQTNSTAISPQLLNSFELGDKRRIYWIDSFQTYYFPYKYQTYTTTTSTLNEYTVVLRLAEVLLIRAEAEANLGDMADAATDLNTVRARANLGPSPTLTASSTLQQADSAILHERQVELFTEWGHRWFDLIRMDSANIVMGAPGNVCHQKGGIWNPDWQLYPIPKSEIIADPNLTQNPGY